MSTLNQKANQINCVISLKEENIKRINERLQTFLNTYPYSYAYILHDKDFNTNGECKTPHIHLVLFNGPRKRLSTYINEISTFLSVRPFAITLDKCISLEGSLQYLVHKNDIEKYHYEVKDIVTNLTQSELDIFLNAENGSLTFDRLFQIIRHAKNKTEVIEKLGLSYYRIYRGIINDIWNDYK